MQAGGCAECDFRFDWGTTWADGRGQCAGLAPTGSQLLRTDNESNPVATTCNTVLFAL